MNVAELIETQLLRERVTELAEANDALERERDAMQTRAERAEAAMEAMNLSSDRLLVERDHYMDRLGRLLPTLTPEQQAIERAALAEGA